MAKGSFFFQEAADLSNYARKVTRHGDLDLDEHLLATIAAHDVGAAGVFVCGDPWSAPRCGRSAIKSDAGITGPGVGDGAGLLVSILHCASLEEERTFISSKKEYSCSTSAILDEQILCGHL